MPIIPAPRSAVGGRLARCPGIRAAAGRCWWVLNPQAFEARWDGTEAPEGVTVSAPYARGSAAGVLMLDLPFMFRTSPGWSLLVRGAPNHPKHGLAAMEALVEADWAYLDSPFAWAFTAPGAVRFEQDEPLAALVPVRRGELQAVAPELAEMPAEVRTQFERWTAEWPSHRVAAESEEATIALSAFVP